MITKQQILTEIKRTAKENGGKPLGSTAFSRVTGISPFHVSRYWARFGEAVREAGFKPNAPWTRYSDELLIKKSIEKIRHYGRYPTLNELFVEFNRGDDFPFHIFKKRQQSYMIEKIVEYCRDHEGYDDIIELCRPIIERLDKRGAGAAISSEKIGEVYLFKSGRYYKIGKTYDSVRRGKEISIELPEKLNLIHSVKTDDPSGVEAYWHKRFEPKRMKGEWFNLSAVDVKAFKRWRRII